MKRHLLIAMPLLFSAIGIVHANEVFYTVPFQNVEVKAASNIYVDYNFVSQKQTLVCQAAPNDGVMSSVQWVYKDASRKIDLPVTLKDNEKYNGYFADPEGKLTITNEFGPDSIFVNCQYQNMQ